jgi:hypothetical protein
MYCTKCGGLAPTTARFCPACGTAVDAAGAAPSHAGAKRGFKRWLIAVIGAIVVAAVAAATYFVVKPAPAPVAGVIASQDRAPEASVAKPGSPATPGFDWSGLSPEELQSARLALDAAIAKEEQAAAAKTAAGSQSPSVP